jgi:hypothetical protein
MSNIIFNLDNKKGGFLKYIVPFTKKTKIYGSNSKDKLVKASQSKFVDDKRKHKL